jgi:hypothetical protein
MADEVVPCRDKNEPCRRGLQRALAEHRLACGDLIYSVRCMDLTGSIRWIGQTNSTRTFVERADAGSQLTFRLDQPALSQRPPSPGWWPALQTRGAGD